MVIFLRPFFFLPSSRCTWFCSRLEDPKVVTVANDGCIDGGDSSDVDENLEKVASQLALTAFAWWTWPWFFLCFIFFCSEGRK